jgi:hypothetical protein
MTSLRKLLCAIAALVAVAAPSRANAQAAPWAAVRKVIYGSSVIPLTNTAVISQLFFPAGQSVNPNKCTVAILGGPFFVRQTPSEPQPGIISEPGVVKCNATSFEMIAGRTQSQSSATITMWRFYWRVIEYEAAPLELVDPNPTPPGVNLVGQDNLLTDRNLLAIGGTPAVGATADGVTRLLLRLDPPGPGSVRFCIGNGTVSTSGGLALVGGSGRTDCVQSPVESTTAGRRAFAVYRTPDDFDDGASGNLAERAVSAGIAGESPGIARAVATAGDPDARPVVVSRSLGVSAGSVAAARAIPGVVRGLREHAGVVVRNQRPGRAQRDPAGSDGSQELGYRGDAGRRGRTQYGRGPDAHLRRHRALPPA